MDLSLKPCTTRRGLDLDLNLKPCAAFKFKKSLGDVDRISSLPDELLRIILSLLPTKDAAATSVLSRRLRRVFTLITTLDFDAKPISHCLCGKSPHLIDRFSHFITFVDNVLQQLQASQSQDLTKFRLSFGLSNANVSPKNLYCRAACFPEMNPMQLSSWMLFPLTRRGIREIDLHFFVRDPSTIKLPRAFFTCETLEVLKLNTNLHLDLHPQVPMPSFRLPNLKVFHLHSERQCQPVVDFVNGLVSSCPLLEDLSVDPYSSRHEHGDSVKISAPCLRRLHFEYLDRNGEEGLCKELVLDAPNLQYLSYVDNLFAQCYYITNMDAIVEATLCIYYETESSYTAFQNMLTLLRPLVNVRRLSLDAFCVQALQDSESGSLKDPFPVFRNLNYLNLGFGSCWGSTQWHRVLLQLLDRTPFLETLAFKGGISKREGYKYDPMNLVELESEYWRTTRAIPSCLKSHLKRVVIMSYCESVRALNLVKFLLGNALVLEELDICTWLTADTCSMMSTLVDLPKASHKCSIKISVYPAGVRESPSAFDCT